MNRLVVSISLAALFALPAGPAYAQETSGADGEETSEESETSPEGTDDELPTLEAQPEEGVDPDLELAFEKAQTALDEGRPQDAVWQIRSIYLSPDQFTKAQRDRRRKDARGLLLDAGDELLSQGNRMAAAQAFDSAWILGDRGTSPEYADLLVRLAEERQNSNQAQALYLARRAKRADPRNDGAKQLDKEISREPLRTPGLISAGVGAVGLVAALVLKSRLNTLQSDIESGDKSRSELDDLLGKYRTNNALFTISAATAGVGLAGGGFMLSFELKNFTPVSPRALPGLPEEEK